MYEVNVNDSKHRVCFLTLLHVVKLGFTGIYIIIFAENIHSWYLLELPHRGALNALPQSMSMQKSETCHLQCIVA